MGNIFTLENGNEPCGPGEEVEFFRTLNIKWLDLIVSKVKDVKRSEFDIDRNEETIRWVDYFRILTDVKAAMTEDSVSKRRVTFHTACAGYAMSNSVGEIAETDDERYTYESSPSTDAVDDAHTDDDASEVEEEGDDDDDADDDDIAADDANQGGMLIASSDKDNRESDQALGRSGDDANTVGMAGEDVGTDLSDAPDPQSEPTDEVAHNQQRRHRRSEDEDADEDGDNYGDGVSDSVEKERNSEDDKGGVEGSDSQLRHELSTGAAEKAPAMLGSRKYRPGWNPHLISPIFFGKSTLKAKDADRGEVEAKAAVAARESRAIARAQATRAAVIDAMEKSMNTQARARLDKMGQLESRYQAAKKRRDEEHDRNERELLDVAFRIYEVRLTLLLFLTLVDGHLPLQILLLPHTAPVLRRVGRCGVCF